MKCLIIANDIGLSAPGIVYQTLIKEMSKYIEITLLTNEILGNLDSNIKLLKSNRRKLNSSTISKKSMALCGIDILEKINAKFNIFKTNFKGVESIDLIISFTSFHNYESLEIAHFLSRRYNLKWIIYSVDAIPAPIGWSKDDRYYKNTIKYISNMIKKSDGFFSSNRQMLDYQLGFVKDYSNLSGVLYTPIREFSTKLEKTSENIIFLYTGSLYGPRKVEVLLSAFKRFIKKYPTSKIQFVGKYYFEQSDC